MRAVVPEPGDCSLVPGGLLQRDPLGMWVKTCHVLPAFSATLLTANLHSKTHAVCPLQIRTVSGINRHLESNFNSFFIFPAF